MPDHDVAPGPGADPGDSGASLYKLVFNWLSIVGIALVAFGLTGTFLFFVVSWASGESPGYGWILGIPTLLLSALGLALIVLGTLRERRRRRNGRGPSMKGEWRFDLNQINKEKFLVTTAVVAGLGSLFILGMGAGSTKIVEYTESDAFCGNVCHSVMRPEATAHEESPHARIACVECHVGSGAESFIRAKLGGVRQLFGVVTGNVERPIPTPIHNLRPSRDMCESCHWPERLIDYKLLSHSYFLENEHSDPRGVRMMVKVGGGKDDLIGGRGIHYHMLNAQKVEYIARDAQRQEIPWVRVTRQDGSSVVYEHLENPLDDSERESLEVRTMECLDCHNRPAHQFDAPVDSVNRALDVGKISREIPYIKRESVRALDGEYETTEEALAGIDASLTAFYRENFPEFIEENPQELERSIATLQLIYGKTIFPEMKADWSAHPDNIGHRDAAGCFRCHNYEMESEEGETIFRECTSCHVLVGQIDPESGGAMLDSPSLIEGMAFLHPDGDELLESQNLCSDCHDGGFRVYEKREDEEQDEEGEEDA